ncbi:hypothetical protein IFM89_023900 [Coptis chinensis]|uniref:Enoyl reductase (ER) domain-containing protein n=1 Tax=Coptis chinensis TaxID=261450 RepID=A0A835M1E4_9MAGN|nr:hypothetical protein IFM89_023900 [Coptis chinensis]
MKAVVITTPGGPEVLKLEEVETPGIGNNQVLIKVEATAISRADTYQRQGNHPPPPGASPYPGLECSGTIEAVGNDVTRWKVGDQVCALLSGGGYAEKVAVSANQVLPVPPGVSLKDAASFPEVACTVWSTVFMTSRLSVGEIFLVHGGSSGIGTFAIQMAKYIGARVFATAGSEEKLAFCKDLGADVCINYKTEDFAARVTEETGGRGVDVILDNIGGPYFQKNLNSLSIDGRLFLLGFQGGPVASDINLAFILARRLTVQGRGRLLGNLLCQCSLGLLEVGLLSTMQSHPDKEGWANFSSKLLKLLDPNSHCSEIVESTRVKPGQAAGGSPKVVVRPNGSVLSSSWLFSEIRRKKALSSTSNRRERSTDLRKCHHCSSKKEKFFSNGGTLNLEGLKRNFTGKEELEAWLEWVHEDSVVVDHDSGLTLADQGQFENCLPANSSQEPWLCHVEIE